MTDRDVLNDSALYTADEQTASTTMDVPPVIEYFTEKIPPTSVETSHFIQIPSTSLNTPQVTDNPAEDKPATAVFVSPQIFKGYPKAGQRKLQKSKRKRAKSCIPTDTPEKEKIEQRNGKKRKRTEEKKGSLQKNVFAKKRKQITKNISSDEDDTEVESEIPFQDDSDEDGWIPEVEPSSFEELDKDPEPNDFVLVQFKAKNDVFFVGKVVELESVSSDVKINFLRKASKVEGHFIFPTVPDIATVPVIDVKMILPKPTLLGNTKRLKSYYKFEINFNQLNMR